MENNQTYTLTFSDQAENHAGMQKIGKLADEGFTLEDLENVRKWFTNKGISCELYFLDKALDKVDFGYVTDISSKNFKGDEEQAFILVAKRGLSQLCENIDQVYDEQINLEKDTKAFMYGRVVNKKARHNLCFGEVDQEPNYENGRGRVISFNKLPCLTQIRSNLSKVLGEKGSNLMCEGNYYYDIEKCYIGYHGDAERRKVVAIRLGEELPLHYQWYYKGEKIGPRVEIVLGHGDLYIMSEKAVGTDWKRKIVPTLRHAAGFSKTLKFNDEVIDSKKLLV